jgi:hypothetical protein
VTRVVPPMCEGIDSEGFPYTLPDDHETGVLAHFAVGMPDEAYSRNV